MRGQNRSRHELQCEDTDATVTAGKPASVPSAHFSNIHSCTNSSWKKNGPNQLVFTHLQVTIYMSDGEQKLSRCCDCAILQRNFKTHRPRPRNRLIFMSNMKRSQRCQTDKDWPGSQGLWLHTPQTKCANMFSPISRHHTVHTYKPRAWTPLIHPHMKHSLLDV